jgi:hypothetical protein
MIVKRLREALEEAAGIMAAAGAKTQYKALQTFVDIFKGQDDQQVPEFLAGLQRQLCQEPSVDRYIEQLLAAGIDKKAFDSVFAELSKDKSIRKDQANAIARRYTDSHASWPTKARAMKEIKASFAERALDAVKMRQVDKASRY